MKRMRWMVGLGFAIAAAGCGDGPGGSVTAPTVTLGTTPSDPGGAATIGYVQDTKLIFEADCVECHGPRRREHNVDLSTYQNVLRNLSPGNANSTLIRESGPRGPMYRYWRGDAAGKAELVRRWIVEFQARENR